MIRFALHRREQSAMPSQAPSRHAPYDPTLQGDELQLAQYRDMLRRSQKNGKGTPPAGPIAGPAIARKRLGGIHPVQENATPFFTTIPGPNIPTVVLRSNRLRSGLEATNATAGNIFMSYRVAAPAGTGICLQPNLVGFFTHFAFLDIVVSIDDIFACTTVAGPVLFVIYEMTLARKLHK